MTISNHNVLADLESVLNELRQELPNTENLAMSSVKQLKLVLALTQKEASHEEIYKAAIESAAWALRVASEGDKRAKHYHPESGYRGKKWEGYKNEK